MSSRTSCAAAGAILIPDRQGFRGTLSEPRSCAFHGGVRRSRALAREAVLLPLRQLGRVIIQPKCRAGGCCLRVCCNLRQRDRCRFDHGRCSGCSLFNRNGRRELRLSIQTRATDTDHCGEKALQNPPPSWRIRGDIIFHQAQNFDVSGANQKEWKSGLRNGPHDDCFCADRWISLDLIALSKGGEPIFIVAPGVSPKIFAVFHCARPALPTSVFCHVRDMSREAQCKFL